MLIRRVNGQVVLEIICFASFGVLLLYFVSSGKYLQYVAPRLKPYLYFTAVTMGMWILGDMKRLFQLQYKIHTTHCLLLLIPLLLFVLPHTPLRAGDIKRTGSQLSVKQNSYGGSTKDSVAEGLPGLDKENHRICVSDEYFGMWYSELYGNMEKYAGYTIIMTGSVMTDSGGETDYQFAPVRLAMTCCVADLAPVGIPCIDENAEELEEGAWVRVEGTLFASYQEYHGEKYADPHIKVEKVEPAEEVEGYVYPY